MSEARLLVARDGAVLTLTLSNPAARNALHPAMYEAAVPALEEAARDPAVRAIMLAGADEFFCAGGNLQRLQDNRAKPKSVQAESIAQLHHWIRALRACPKPIVAGVDGAAAGAGFSLALACDFIVAGRSAKFVVSYVKVGLSPDGGATWSLSRALPRTLVNELAMTGQPITAERLHALGVVNRLVDDGQARDAALAFAAELAAGPAHAMARIKALVQQAEDVSLDAQLDAERDSFVECLHHPEAGEGIAAFLDKRKPRFP